MIKSSGLFILFLVATMPLIAQTVVRGKVMDSKTDQPLDGATIFNTTEGIIRKAGENGEFTVRGKLKDVIIISSAGYRPDTVQLSDDFIASGLFIGLATKAITLDTLTISQRTYSEDSLQRRTEYQHFLDRPTRDIRGGNRPQSGFGVSVSPITYFSRSEKEKRQFKKEFNAYEQEAYIDYRFSTSYVHRLTGLQGDELQRYMKTYRPSYAFLRTAEDGDLLIYVNDTFKKFRAEDR